MAYWLIYAYTYSRYDGDTGKYLLTEGLQTVQPQRPDGIGLQNLRRQLELFYPAKSRLETGREPESGIYSAYLYINFNKYAPLSPGRR